MQAKEKDIWLKTYHAARALWSEAPWERFSNSDIIHVNLPKHGDVYALILGNGRQQYGISVFAGPQARDNLIRRFCYMNRKFRNWPMDEAACQDCLTLDFDEDSVLDETFDEQLKRRKNLGVNPWFSKNRRPCLSHYVPYMMPVPMKLEEAEILTAAIYAVIEANHFIPFLETFFHFNDIDVYHYDLEEKTYTTENIQCDESVLPAMEMGSVPWKVIYDLKKEDRIPVELELEGCCSDGTAICEDGVQFIRAAILSVVNGGIYDTRPVEHDANMGQAMLDSLVAFCEQEGIPEVIYVRNVEAARRIAPLTGPLDIEVVISDLDGEGHLGWEMVNQMSNGVDHSEAIAQMESVLLNVGQITQKELTKYRMKNGQDKYEAFVVEQFADLMNTPGMYDLRRMLAMGRDPFEDDD